MYLNFTFAIVFVTKYRKKVFTDAILKDIEVIFNNVCKDFDTELVEMNGETDHVHLLLNYPPKVSISKLVNSLKGVSSRLRAKTTSRMSLDIIGKVVYGRLAILLALGSVRHYQ